MHVQNVFPLPELRWKALPAQPYFAGTPEDAQPASVLRRAENVCYRVSPISGFIGAAGLILSSVVAWFAPSPTTPKPQMDTPIVQKAEALPVEISAPETRSFLQQLAAWLKVAGVAGASTCYGTIGLNTIGMGLRRKQPSIFLGGILTTLGGLGLLWGDPGSIGRAAILTSVATFNAGYANMLRQKKSTDPIREMEMAPRFQKIAEMIKFSWDDHKLMVVDIGRSLSQLEIKTLPSRFGKEAAQVLAYLQGKTDETPVTLQKQPLLAQTSGLIMYATGIPLFFLGGSKDAVANTLMAMAGAGRALGNLSLIAVAAEGTKVSEKAFYGTVPAGLVGGMMYGTDLGLGLAVSNTANVAEYLREQAVKAPAVPVVSEDSP